MQGKAVKAAGKKDPGVPQLGRFAAHVEQQNEKRQKRVTLEGGEKRKKKQKTMGFGVIDLKRMHFFPPPPPCRQLRRSGGGTRRGRRRWGSGAAWGGCRRTLCGGRGILSKK